MKRYVVYYGTFESHTVKGMAWSKADVNHRIRSKDDALGDYAIFNSLDEAKAMEED